MQDEPSLYYARRGEPRLMEMVNESITLFLQWFKW